MSFKTVVRFIQYLSDILKDIKSWSQYSTLHVTEIKQRLEGKLFPVNKKINMLFVTAAFI